MTVQPGRARSFIDSQDKREPHAHNPTVSWHSAHLRSARHIHAWVVIGDLRANQEPYQILGRP